MTEPAAVVPPVSTFDRQDEDELEVVTSECLNGMCFLASK